MAGLNMPPEIVRLTQFDEKTSEAALDLLYAMLPGLLEEAQHYEMWGIDFTNADDENRSAPRSIVLQKFLRANKFNVVKAAAQFRTVLRWRRQHNPRASSLAQVYERNKFEGIGYVTSLRGNIQANPMVITWNLYNRVKDLDGLFRDDASYQEFRIALMELAIDELGISQARGYTRVGWKDQYKIIQVHDCAGTNPARVFRKVRKGLWNFANLFQEMYPDLLKYHHFVELGWNDTVGMNAGWLLDSAIRGSLGYRIGHFKITRKREQVAKDIFPESEAGYLILRRSIPVEFGGDADSVGTARTVLLSAVGNQTQGGQGQGQEQQNAEQNQDQPQDPPGSNPQENKALAIFRNMFRKARSPVQQDNQVLLNVPPQGHGAASG
ncbi:hypothetical protein SODALDRAFT_124830 [Sodiomyces alkalinus F11]|uniref:Phosphatidylinositol transfer protein SFH5 n=1 Tax=Sodiomyces alkalinus (strain CBS 110278 / VKM F-3762 / F11) TaxID=1314773 RepID=A0A3N2Q4D6_SODAK|nr:hypothetical protein SODALDRAFT_124830 [Sodiomyces alkalinus F11]ROT41643.1 hypothetical protein SODALDRAFT_124830 [Sodiomyces alkalinus F11]